MSVRAKIDLSPAEAVALKRLAEDHKDIAAGMTAETTEDVDFMLRVHGSVTKAKNTSANTRDLPSGPEVVAWLFGKLTPDARLRLTTLFAEEVKARRALIDGYNEARKRAADAASAASDKPEDADLACMAKALADEFNAMKAPEILSVDQNCLLQARQMIDLSAIEKKTPRSGATKAQLTIESVDLAALKPAVLKKISESSRTIVFD